VGKAARVQPGKDCRVVLTGAITEVFPRHGSTTKSADELNVTNRPALLLLSLVVLVTNFTGESSPVIRRTVSEVQIRLVATDHDGKAVPTLKPADITVLEDGQPIRNFELRPASDLPLRVGILLDTSDSTSAAWLVTKAAVADFLRQTLRPDDQALIVAFDSRVELERMVTDPQQAVSLIATPHPGGQTALFDTVYSTCQNALFNDFREPRRSAIIIFSDGKDNLSWHDLDQTIEKAEFNGIAVYSISTHGRRVENSGDAVLHSLAATTGGHDFVVSAPREMREALLTVREELRSSYLLYYHPPNESAGQREFRRVRVVPAQDSGPLLRHKSGYYTVPVH
jgi:Ca-activated chloride channel homolog